MGDEQVLDLKEFLERVQDDKELLLELLDIFVEDYKDKSRQLDEAVQRNNYEQVRSVAHSLKGASGNISAKVMCQTFTKLEEMGKDSNLAGAGELLRALKGQFEDFTVRINQIKEELES